MTSVPRGTPRASSQPPARLPGDVDRARYSAVASAAARGRSAVLVDEEGRQPDHERGPLARRSKRTAAHMRDVARAARAIRPPGAASSMPRRRRRRRPARASSTAASAAATASATHSPRQPQAAMTQRRGEQRERAAGRHVRRSRGRAPWRGRAASACAGAHQRGAGDREQHEADAFDEARERAGREVLDAAAPSSAAGGHAGEADEREALAAEPVAEHAGEHADQHADHVEHGRDEAGLDQRQAELGAQRGSAGGTLRHVGAGGQAAGEDGPDAAPVAGHRRLRLRRR